MGFDFHDGPSHFLWDSLRLADFPVLVPHRPGQHGRDFRERQLRADQNLDRDADVVFLEVEVDDPSNFFQRLSIEVVQEERRFIIKVRRCVSAAHAIAAVVLEMSRSSKPPGLHFGGSEMDLSSASWSYFAFGEGNIPWKVRELILRAEPGNLGLRRCWFQVFNLTKPGNLNGAVKVVRLAAPPTCRRQILSFVKLRNWPARHSPGSHRPRELGVSCRSSSPGHNGELDRLLTVIHDLRGGWQTQGGRICRT